MILIGIGSNLPSIEHSTPLAVCEVARQNIIKRAGPITHASSWYETAPIPASAQPNYVNGVIAIETDLDSLSLLAILQDIENQLGRVRAERNAARIIDLDLLAYDDEVLNVADLELPHPRLTERAFVARPIAEIAPTWRHPITNKPIAEILEKLTDQKITQISA